MQRSSSTGCGFVANSPSSMLKRSGLETIGTGTSSPAMIPTTDSRSANFVPKLLSKLSTLEDKVSQSALCKLDASTYQRDRELAKAREENMMDELRVLREMCTMASSQAKQALAVVASKADASECQRNTRSVHELTATLQTKADLESLQKLQADCGLVVSNVDTLRQAVSQTASLNVTDCQEARLDELASVLHLKADHDMLLQLQSEMAALETPLEQLNRVVNMKADHAALDRIRNDLHALNVALQSKCDVESFRDLQSRCMPGDKSSETLIENRDSSTIATTENLEILQDDVRQLFFAVNEKADGEVVKNLESAVTSAAQHLDELKHDLELRRKVEMDLLERVGQLQLTSQSLQDLSHILVQTKADLDSVPHLHVNVLEQI
eukprot:TRINITY_DN62240_c0_g1_i1.p1 TRINITY_DN62240_c0_g1~~TRINITY_DN62240_c0_g1_i1.p1  ORF type:complete len:382 (+),score=64.60 TRINITY_DN62240_c0_g1_i1:118-1263(+)